MDNPFEFWKHQIEGDTPNEDDEHAKISGGYTMKTNEDGSVEIVVTPTPQMRMSAAILAGCFMALLETDIFTREEAFTLLRQSIHGVVVIDDEDE